MHVLLAIYHYFLNIPASSYYHFAEFMVAGAGIQVTIQALKYWKALKGRSHVLRFLNGALSSIVVGVSYLNTSGINLAAFGKQAAALAVVSNVLYRFFNSTLYLRFEQLEAKAVAYDNVGKPAVNPGAAMPPAPAAPRDFTLTS